MIQFLLHFKKMSLNVACTTPTEDWLSFLSNLLPQLGSSGIVTKWNSEAGDAGHPQLVGVHVDVIWKFVCFLQSERVDLELQRHVDDCAKDVADVQSNVGQSLFVDLCQGCFAAWVCNCSNLSCRWLLLLFCSLILMMTTRWSKKQTRTSIWAVLGFTRWRWIVGSRSEQE